MTEQRTASRSADPALVRRLRSQVADRLNQQRRSDEVLGRTPMSAEDERQFARSLIVQVLEDYARGEITDGRTPPTAEEEEVVAAAVHAALFGVGRLQPLLENPEVENIDINGCDRVFVRYADGREELAEPGGRQRRGAGRADPDPRLERGPGLAPLRLRQPAARPAPARRLAAVGGDGGVRRARASRCDGPASARSASTTSSATAR